MGVRRLFGTSPWGLIVFLLLGFAAGVLSVLRSAGLIEAGADWTTTGPTGIDEGGDVATDPIHQFHIQKLVPIEVGGVDFSFTNSALFMVITVVGASAFLILSARGRGLVPGRWQSAAEVVYEFVAKTLRDSDGKRRHALLPAGLLPLHLHPVRQHVGHVPLFLHGHLAT